MISIGMIPGTSDIVATILISGVQVITAGMILGIQDGMEDGTAPITTAGMVLGPMAGMDQAGVDMADIICTTVGDFPLITTAIAAVSAVPEITDM